MNLTFSPLIGSDGRVWGNPRDRLPHAPVPLRFSSVSGHGAGSFGPVVSLRVVLAATASHSALRLADALAAAQAVDDVLGDGLVEALPVLLRDKDSGKHDEKFQF